MGEGTRKLNLTLKFADRLITLSTVVSDFVDEGPEITVRRFNRWVKRTRELLAGNIEGSRLFEFDSLPKPGRENNSLEEIHYCSREHADFLRNVVSEIDGT
jgi:hypothetical protein